MLVIRQTVEEMEESLKLGMYERTFQWEVVEID